MRIVWIGRGCSREGMVVMVMVMGDGCDDDEKEEDTVSALPGRLHASQRRRTR